LDKEADDMFARILALTGSLLTLVSATSTSQPVPLADLALQKVLNDAAPIFGEYTKSAVNTSTWMKSIADNTPIVRMNIPGTHDSATWNYSLATQKSLNGITSQLNGEAVLPPPFFRCQDRSFVAMLNAGIRVFDLRYAFDATNSTIVFYHSGALLSETATLTDVLFGFYTWLDDHPSEVVLLSLQYEGGTKAYGGNDNVAMQTALFSVLTAPHAKQYFLQTPKNAFPTLGQARGKMILLRRFDLDLLPSSYDMTQVPGIHFPPAQWTDNSPDIVLVCNTTTNATAYIEDYYQPLTPFGSSAQENIQWKYNATTSHLLRAVSPKSGTEENALWWTFASSENDDNIPFDYPRIMATGNGTQYTPEGGVNQKLVPFLKTLKGKRVGIIMFDFYETPGDLVGTLLSL
jgi:1-phosphatidylinositol phosphodiesterase